VTGRAPDRSGGGKGADRVTVVVDRRDEDRDNLIAHIFVDDSAVLDQNLACRAVEAVHELAKRGRRHLLRQRRRTAHVGE
jgi:hypothetical protein